MPEESMLETLKKRIKKPWVEAVVAASLGLVAMLSGFLFVAMPVPATLSLSIICAHLGLGITFLVVMRKQEGLRGLLSLVLSALILFVWVLILLRLAFPFF